MRISERKKKVSILAYAEARALQRRDREHNYIHSDVNLLMKQPGIVFSNPDMSLNEGSL